MEPISIVRSKFRLRVGVVNPHKNTSHALRNAADFYRPLRAGILQLSQLPPQLRDANGTIVKPPTW